MTARRPSKPWRVTIRPGDIETAHTSKAKAFAHMRAELFVGNGSSAHVHCWEDGRWRLFETMRKEDMP